MLVRHLHMRNFIPYEDAEISLPDKGIVFVTGPNYAGKTVLIDAVSTAIWNKTVRGPLGWKDKAECSVAVTASGREEFSVLRRRTPGGSLRFEMTGGGDYGAAKKAEERIIAEVGEWDTWRKTSVFLSDEAGVFSTATDKERKLFIEKMLDVDFETARKKCADDRREIEAQVTIVGRQQSILEERSRHQGYRVKELEERAKAERIEQESHTKERHELKTKLDQLKFLIDECIQDGKSAAAENEDLRAELVRLQTSVDQMRKHVTHLDRDECPTCHQPIPEELRQKLRNEWKEAEAASQPAREALEAQIKSARDAISQLQQELTTMRQKKEDLVRKDSALSQREEASKKAQAAADRIEDDLAQARAELQKTTDDLAETKAELADLNRELPNLVAAEQILGTKGFRAHLLSTAISSIELVANIWLERLAGTDVQLELAVDNAEVKLNIVGERWGAGRGYKALSQSQRRRIDLALMLALADFVAGANQQEPGTLWIDEVCDSLDKEGVAAAAAVIRELAESQPVVLISHSDELFDAVSPDRHVKVANGRISG